MSKNTLTAHITFYFKGEKFDFSTEIDVDQWLHKHMGDMEYIYDVVALANGLDRYRHEYDVMVMEPMTFLNGTGLAASFLEDGVFDLAAYQQASEQQAILNLLQGIAKEYLHIEQLTEHPDVQAALLAAYQAKK